jgi:hypothetical protein
VNQNHSEELSHTNEDKSDQKQNKNENKSTPPKEALPTEV